MQYGSINGYNISQGRQNASSNAASYYHQGSTGSSTTDIMLISWPGYDPNNVQYQVGLPDANPKP